MRIRNPRGGMFNANLYMAPKNPLKTRLKNGLLTKELCGEIYEATRRYGRLNWEAPSVQQALRDRGSR